MTSFSVLPTVRSSTDSMWLAIVERVHRYLVQKVACRVLVTYIGKAVPVYVQARNRTYATPEHAAVDKKAGKKTVVKLTG